MGHSIGVSGYAFPDNIESLSITYNLSNIYYKAIKRSGYKIKSLGEHINGKKMKDLQKFFIDIRNELESRPKYYKKFNPENGRGSYKGLLRNINYLIVAGYEKPNAKLNDRY